MEPSGSETPAAEARTGDVRTNEYGQPVGDPVEPGTARRPGGEVLTGRGVRLEPLDRRHLPGLYAATCAAGTEPRWTYMGYGPFADEDAYASAMLALVDDPEVVPYAIVDAPTGRALGVATYLRISAAARTIEVGHVMYGPELAGTTAATEAMHLMAEHAFALGYRRYEWKCDALNAPSRRAAERLGFRFEGVWRQALSYKGRNRDTAWYAMTDGDWARIGRVQAAWIAAAYDAGDGVAPPYRLSDAIAAGSAG